MTRADELPVSISEIVSCRIPVLLLRSTWVKFRRLRAFRIMFPICFGLRARVLTCAICGKSHKASICV